MSNDWPVVVPPDSNVPAHLVASFLVVLMLKY